MSKDLPSNDIGLQNEIRDGGLLSEDFIEDPDLKDKIVSKSWEYTPLFLKDIFKEQKDDPIWAKKVKDEAEQLFQREDTIGTNLVEVQCGQTLCKSVQIHNSEQDFAFFRDKVDGPWARGESHGTSQMMDDGTIQSTVYFSKNDDTSAFKEAIVRISEL